MQSLRDAVSLEWESVGQVADLPAAVLYGLVLTVAHTANHIPWEGVRRAFGAALGGQPKERKILRGVEMVWDGGKVPVRVVAKRKQVRVRALNRVTPARLNRIMRALTEIPNTGRVRLRAQAQRFVRLANSDAPME